MYEKIIRILTTIVFISVLLSVYIVWNKRDIKNSDTEFAREGLSYSKLK